MTRLACGFLFALLLSPALADDPPAATTPRAKIALFNGRDLTGLTVWMKGTGHEDPKQAFSVAEGMLRVSGEGAGYIRTNASYQNYRMSVEYRWGKKTDGSKFVRNSGVLLNAIAPDGAAGAWPTCIECQLAQGCEGDLIVIRGKDANGRPQPATLTSETRQAEDGKTRWHPGGMKTVYSGRQFWWSRHQPFFEELLDTRGKEDVASPLGQWTRVEVLQRPGKLTIKVNGVTVNECFDVQPAAGAIALQNEENEIYFRDWYLEPLAADSP